MKKKERKIAILGTAPSTIQKAPVNEKEWEIWACSPGLAGVLPRWDRWFEIHTPEEVKEVSPEFYEWMHKQKRPIYTLYEYPDVKSSITFPREMIEKRFNTWFLTSTIAWMLALAITEKPTHIGIWGVDMMDHTEYGAQKFGCLHFIAMARAHGVNIVLPEASELLVKAKPYPDSHCSEDTIILDRRLTYQRDKITNFRKHLEKMNDDHTKAIGAIEEIEAIKRLMLVRPNEKNST